MKASQRYLIEQVSEILRDRGAFRCRPLMIGTKISLQA